MRDVQPLTVRPARTRWSARASTALCLVLLALVAVAAAAITAMEMDDFEDGTTEGWTMPASSSSVSNVADGGPDGAGDNYLEVVSSGAGGPGGKMTVVSGVQWLGDYNGLGAEITVSMQVANFGASPLNLRVGLEGAVIPMDTIQGNGPRYVNSTAFPLPADGVWREAMFTFSDAEMTLAEGLGSLQDVLDDVVQFRVVSSSTASWRGDEVAGTLGIDDVAVVSLPVDLMSYSVD